MEKMIFVGYVLVCLICYVSCGDIGNGTDSESRVFNLEKIIATMGTKNTTKRQEEDTMVTIMREKLHIPKLESRLDWLEVTLAGRMCQIGSSGCNSAWDCGMDDFEEDGDDQIYTNPEDITFSPPFAKTPTVRIAMSSAYMRADDEVDLYGWSFRVEDVSKNGFKFIAVMKDRKFYNIRGVWIACSV